jgi:hypothetical protein
MKRKFFITTMLLGLAIVGYSQTASLDIETGGAPGVMPKFSWEEKTHNFGKIEQNLPVVHEFQFSNTGKSPLVISAVKGSCGCTVTEYTKEPVAPGKSGIVKATFNAKAMGSFNKSIRVTANVEGGAETLYIKGEVVKN